jgi:hypothetical protein
MGRLCTILTRSSKCSAWAQLESTSLADISCYYSNVSNMLFIDHPAQVGFSYSEPIPGYVSSSGSIVELPNATCPDYAEGLACGTYSYPNETDTANSTAGAAPSMWKTLQGFMGVFPQYSRHEFNFATESYGFVCAHFETPRSRADTQR